GRVGRQEVSAGIAGVPSLRTQVGPALDLKPQGHLSRRKQQLRCLWQVLEPPREFDRQLSGYQRHLAGTVDNGVRMTEKEKIAADVLVASDRELRKAAQWRKVLALGARDAQPGGRRLAGGSVID